MDPFQLIREFYPEGSLAGNILIKHSQAVSAKALLIANKLNLKTADRMFIQEASLLHDIGIMYTDAPDLGCSGNLPYICHGFMGHDLLVSKGLPSHALVCERHTGAGLTISDIKNQRLPIPIREMVPVSLAEQIIAYSDKFFSKNPDQLTREYPFEEVLATIGRYGQEKAVIFAEWHKKFNF